MDTPTKPERVVDVLSRLLPARAFSMSAAFGAAIGRPDAVVVAVMGDGSFGFAFGERKTIVRRSVPVTTRVFSNAVFGWTKASQKAGYQELQDTTVPVSQSIG